MKCLKIFCVMAIIVAMSAFAYAETQSIKVSGDITERAFARSNFDLDHKAAAPNNGTVSNDWSTYLLSTVEVQIDADLTDNVSGVVRLVNQRVWGDNNYTSDGTATSELQNVNYNGITTAGRARAAGGDSYAVDVDLAYIELKEFLYSPLTLKIGRQDLWFGRGFIVGANLQNPNNNIWPAEYTAIQSFDAIRATLDFDPWTIDAVYAKIAENAREADDDVNLMGINVGYVFDDYNAEVEAYYWLKQSRNPGATAGISITSQNGHIDNSVNTFGFRGSFDPIEDWTIAVENAYQWGQYMGIARQDADRPRQAWAIDAMIECRAFQDDFDWKPVVSLEYIFYSGEENMGNQGTVTANGVYHGWDPMFRGKFDTAIREWQNVFYNTTVPSSPSFTNQHQVLLRGTIEPTDDITFDALYGAFWLDKTYQNQWGGLTPNNTNMFVGQEVDLNLTWDYTEDVSFGLLTAWFYPGDHFSSFQSDDVAADIVGTVKLSF